VKQTILPVIKGRFQSFVKDDYPNFAKFMGDYFGWLEQDENFLSILNDWRSNTEPSNNIEPYIDAILEDVGFDITQDISIPKSTLLHFMKDFYLARGSVQSFEFLFKVLFANKMRIEYPRERMLIPSYAAYGEKFYVYTSANNVGTREYLAIMQNVSELAGSLEGLSSKVIVSIEAITPILGNDATYLEIEILKSVGDFIVGENVRLTIGDNEIIEAVQNVASIVITNGGSGYQVNDQVRISKAEITSNGFVSKVGAGGITNLTITNPGCSYSIGDLILGRKTVSTDGSGFSAIVSEIGSSGEILAYELLNAGYGFTVLPDIIIKRLDGSTPTGCDAVIVPSSSQIGKILSINLIGANVDFANDAAATVTSETGAGAVLALAMESSFSRADWENDRGFLGENSTLIDSDKYQQYSYEIISSVSPSRYISIVDDMLHPVGYVRSAVIEIESSVVLNTPVSTNFSVTTSVVNFVSDDEGDFIVTNTGDLIIIT
jgi:hypothetical protein